MKTYKKKESAKDKELKEYYATFCLLEQPFVREPKTTVGQLVQEKIAIIKENLVIRRFSRFRVGEDVQTQLPGENPQTPQPAQR